VAGKATAVYRWVCNKYHRQDDCLETGLSSKH